MRRLRRLCGPLLLLSWYFMVGTSSGGIRPSQPFMNQQDCEDLRAWWARYNSGYFWISPRCSYGEVGK